MVTSPLYSAGELSEIRKAKDIKELQDIARRYIYSIRGRGGVRMLCAPLDVSNGIKEEERLYSLILCEGRQTIMNHRIFSYVPFIKRSISLLGCSCADALHAMRYPFFYGFIHTGWVDEYYLLPNWQNSPFCLWVQRQASQDRHDRKLIFWSEE